MKPKPSLLPLLIAALLPYPGAQAQNLDAETLSFGTGNVFSNGSYPRKGAAIGGGNEIRADYNLAIGSGNKFWSSSNLAVGAGNWIGNGWPGNSSAGIGSGNKVSGDNSLAVGSYNNMDYDSEFGSGRNSLLAGDWNYSMGKASFVTGSNNSIPYYQTGDEWDPLGFPTNTMLLGIGLISRTDDCVVVGKNNSAASIRQTGDSAPVFVVGTGQSASARADAFVVCSNGDIVITKPQGDISMGAYE